MKKTWIIAYDIREAKRLRKMEKLCEAYTFRLQYSLYQMEGEPRALKEFIEKMKKFVDLETDSIIIFELDSHDLSKMKLFGNTAIDKSHYEKDYWIL